MLLKLAAKNVKKHWRKSTASILAISSSFIAQTVFVGYLDYVDSLFVGIFESKEMHGDLTIENQKRLSDEAHENPFQYNLNRDQIQKIEEWLSKNEVESLVKSLEFSGVITNGKNQMVVVGKGISLADSARMRGSFDWNAKYGLPIERQNTEIRSYLGTQLGATMGCYPTPAVHLALSLDGYPKVFRPFHCDNSVQLSVLTESEQINALDFEVGGVIDGGIRELDTRLVILDLQTAQRLMNTDKITYMNIKVKDNVSLNDFSEKLNSFLKELDPNLRAMSWRVHPSGKLYRESMGLLNAFRYFVVIVVLAVTGMSVFNTSLKAVMERTKEIGALLSIGFRKKQIRSLFIIETTLLVIGGNFIGGVLAVIITLICNSLGIEYKAGLYSEPAVFHINVIPFDYLSAGMVTLFVAVGTTFFAVRKFLGRKIIQNLNG